MDADWSGIERRKVGRPPLSADEHSINVHVRLPASQYDAVCTLALRRGESLPCVIRRALARIVVDERTASVRI